MSVSGQHTNKRGAGRKFKKDVIDSLIIRIIADRSLRNSNETTEEELFRAVNKNLVRMKGKGVELRAFQYHMSSKRLNKRKIQTGLIPRGVIEKVDIEYRLNVKYSHSLIDIATILTKDIEKGDLILRSIDTAFLKCYNSYLGDSLSGWKRDIWRAEDGREVYGVRIPIHQKKADVGNPYEIWSKETIEMNMKRVIQTKGEASLAYKMSYVFFVMNNSKKVKECAISRTEDRLHWFTAWDKSKEFIINRGQKALNYYEDIASEFFDTVIREPLIHGTSSFNLFKSGEKSAEYMETFVNEIDWILYHLMLISPFASVNRRNESIKIISNHLGKMASMDF